MRNNYDRRRSAKTSHYIHLAAAMVLLGLVLEPAYARQQLDSAEIRQAVTGKRIFLKVPLGGEFPLRYRSNGLVDGDGTAVGLGRRFAPKETGRWWVRNDQLCQQWKTWYNGKVACFELYKTGENRLFWRRNDGRTGRARIE